MSTRSEVARSRCWAVRSPFASCRAFTSVRCSACTPNLLRDRAHPTAARRLGSPLLPHVHWDRARPCHICTGTGLTPFHICIAGLGSTLPLLHRGTGLTPVTSAPRLGSAAALFAPGHYACLPGQPSVCLSIVSSGAKAMLSRDMARLGAMAAEPVLSCDTGTAAPDRSAPSPSTPTRKGSRGHSAAGSEARASAAKSGLADCERTLANVEMRSARLRLYQGLRTRPWSEGY